MITVLLLPGALATELPKPDIALATRVSPGVVIASDAKVELVPFSKVREGDVLTLPAEGRVELMYFADGHSETFAGPLELVVGTAAEPVSRSDGDALVGDALRGLPALAKRAELDKGGHTLVRGELAKNVPLDEDEKADVETARLHYRALREKADESEILPELYLATVLLNYSQGADALAVLQSARGRCETCRLPAELIGWIDPPASN